jgi:nicotinate-nucleotide pyrophosphorylase (carboxylating)
MQEKVLEERLLAMITEDSGFSDITTAFTPNKIVKAEIIAKEAGVVSGIYELQVLFRFFGITAQSTLKDGGRIKKGQRIFLLSGYSRDILLVERTALNILARMTGISTLTNKYVEEAKKAGSNVKIAATRKTTPLFGFFEKEAVKTGGGDTHRCGLYDEVLIKDNHMRLFKSVSEALKVAKKETSFAHKIEVEVTNLKDAIAAASNGADIILIDNMAISEIKKTVAELGRKGLRDKVLLEASGGVTLENVKDYAATGIDIISIGRLTHSAPALDVSLEII